MTRVIKPESGECRMSFDMRHEKTIVFEERISVLRLEGGFPEKMEMRGLPESSVVFVSIPTPFGGRRDASSGRGWAGSVSGKTGNGAVALMQRDRSGRNSGNTSLSQPGGAHAAGACPPRASKKNRNRTVKTGSLRKSPGTSIKNCHSSRETGFPLKCREGGAP